MKEFIEESVVYVMVAAIFYTGFSLCVTFAGLNGAQVTGGGKFAGKIPCLEQPTNFEMLFPAYKLGCWIGAKQGEKYYWSKP